MGMDIQEVYYQLTYESPCGILRIHSNGMGVFKIERVFKLDSSEDNPDQICRQAKQELEEYFDGDRITFGVSLDLSAGTGFQQNVWNGLRKIPFGCTVLLIQAFIDLKRT